MVIRRGDSGEAAPRKKQRRESSSVNEDSDEDYDDDEGMSDSDDSGGSCDAPADTVRVRIIPNGGTRTARDMEQTVFDSWADVDAFLHAYGEATFQIYTMQGNTPAATRNSRTSEKFQIPLELGDYNKVWRCTHGGRKRQRAKGARPHQKIRWTGCCAQVNACVKKVEGGHKIFITKQLHIHNHELSSRVYRRYAAVRNVVPSGVAAQVAKMAERGAERRTIWHFIRDNGGGDVEMRDVHNMIQKLRRNGYSASTLEGRVNNYLKDFGEVEGNTSRIFQTSEGIADCVVFQTNHMRRMFEQFPEVVLIDATHGTNRENYKLFSFMVHDLHGHGQHVQHALLENERAPTLHKACAAFKAANPAWSRIECLMIDKDFTELAVLRDEFPNARILLCEWHVKKYLRKEIYDHAKYGFTTFEKSELESCTALLVGAASEAAYGEAKAYMLSLISDIDRREKWLQYYDNNWESCRDMWTAFLRGNVAHLGNTTNNRLESSWAKLKRYLSQYLPLDESIVAILLYQARCEEAWLGDSIEVGTVSIFGVCDELQRLANEVSRHAYDLIKEQWDLSVKLAYKFYTTCSPLTFIQYDPSVVNERESIDDDAGRELDDVPDEYAVNTRSWRCSCLFMCTRRMPCRHVLFIRRAKGLRDTVPFKFIDERWKLATAATWASEIIEGDDFNLGYAIERDDAHHQTPRHTTLGPREKFRLMSQVTSEIVSITCNLGTPAFMDVLTFYERVKRVLQRGERPALDESRESLTTEATQLSQLLFFDESSNEFDDINSLQLPQDGVLDDSNTIRLTQDDELDESNCLQPTQDGVREGVDIQLIQDVEDRPSLVTCGPSLATSEPSLATSEPIVATSEPSLATSEPIVATSEPSLATSEPIVAASELNGRCAIELEAGIDVDDSFTSKPFTIPSATRAGRPAKHPTQQRKANNARLKQTKKRMSEFLNGDELNLQSLGLVLRGSVSLNSSYDYLRRYKLADCSGGARPSVTLLGNAGADPRTITEIFPTVFIAKLRDQANKFRDRYRSSAVGSVDVSKLSLRYTYKKVAYTADALAIMMQWHRAMQLLAKAHEAVTWLAVVQQNRFMPDDRFTDIDISFDDVTDRLKNMNVLSEHSSLLDFASKGQLDDDSMTRAMAWLCERFGCHLVNVIGSSMPWTEAKAEILSSTGAFLGTGGHLVAIHIPGLDHWCGALVEVCDDEVNVAVFDPYSAHIQDLKKHVKKLIDPLFETYVMKVSYPFDQLDNYNCGVYVLMTMEFLHRRIWDPRYNCAEAAIFFRYRYMAHLLPE